MAVDIGAAQSAKGAQLQAANLLGRLWLGQGKPQQAREMLAPLYSWFSEGFETRDLSEAKVLLKQLSDYQTERFPPLALQWRDGSRFQLYVRRIPVDVRERLVGRTLYFPLGEDTHAVTISPRAQAIRFSLRADEPAEVKARIAAADQYLERILRAFRDENPTSLTNAQATALAGRLYKA